MPSDYSKALRAIGYALEALQVNAFELTYEASNYVVRVNSQKTDQPQKHSIAATRILEALRHLFRDDYPPKSSTIDSELIYTPKEIEWLDHEGQLRRGEGETADPQSLPQGLRAIGAYLDLKGACLRQISWNNPITIEYEINNECATEKFTPASLYELFVRLYIKRRDRQKR